MIYLIQYDRKAGKIRQQKSFPVGQRAEAQRERLAIELDLYSKSGGVPCEVVLLEAADEQTLRRTHQRYFKSPLELVESMMQPEPVLP